MTGPMVTCVFGIELLGGLGQHMGGVVADQLQGFRGAGA